MTAANIESLGWTLPFKTNGQQEYELPQLLSNDAFMPDIPGQYVKATQNGSLLQKTTGRSQPSADPCWNFGALILKMQHDNNCLLAEKIKNRHKTGVKQFYKFCKKCQIEQLGPILPTSENELCLFATGLASTVSHATIKIYLTAVKHLHFQDNCDLPLNQFNNLQHLLRGIKHYQGTVTQERKQITPAHL